MDVVFDLENIVSVPSINNKIQTIKEIYKDKGAYKAYNEVILLIENLCASIIEEYFYEEVTNKTIIFLSKHFKKHEEKEIYEILLFILYNEEIMPDYDEYELNYLIVGLDKVIEICKERYSKVL